MNLHNCRRGAAALAIALLLAGCGKTNQDVINEQRGAMDALRTKLADISQTLPEAADEQKAEGKLSPEPVYSESDTANTDIVMYDHLVNPDDDMNDGDDLDLLLSEHLLTPLQWAGPDNPMSESVLGDSAGDFEQEFKRAAGLSYLGVARVRSYEPAVAIDEQTFQGGAAEIDGYLVSLKDNEILCSFSIAAEPDESVSYSYKPNQDRKTQLEGFVRSSIWEDGRTKLIEGFREHCGGEWTIDP
ncbi:MAG TPA: hypothetical protein VGE07_09735 [Herpetosiphonaceae bacterium]